MPDHQGVILAEMVIKLKGQSDDIVRDRPIKELRSFGMVEIQERGPKQAGGETSESVLEGVLPSVSNELDVSFFPVVKTEEVLLDKGITRLKINLIDLRRWLDTNRRIVPARLWIGRQDNERPSGLRLENIKLVSFSDKSQPAVAFLGRRQLKRWGAILGDTVRDGVFEWPVIDRHFPFSGDVNVNYAISGEWIDIDWPGHFPLQEGTRIHLGITDGEERITSIRVTAFHDGSELGSWTMPPNGSVEMRGEWEGEQDVDHINLQAYLKPGPQIVSFKELVLFRSRDFSFEALMDQFLPGLLGSIRDEIKLQPILEWNGQSVHPDDRVLKRYGGRQDVLGFRVDQLSFNDLANLNILDHPWLEVSRIILESEQPLAIDERGSNDVGTQPKESEGSPTIIVKLVFYLAALVVIWWMAKKSWLQKAWRGVVFIFKWPRDRSLLVLRSFCGISPGLDQIIKFLSDWRGSAFLWSAVTISLFVVGQSNSDPAIESYWFIAASVTALMVWRALLFLVRSRLEAWWPALATKVYGEVGVRYLLGFIVTLILTGAVLVFSLTTLAVQLTLVGYMLLICMVLESAYRKTNID
jgi:hypothetical protein